MSELLARPIWYAQGLRWIGGLFLDAAQSLETVAQPAQSDSAFTYPEERLHDARDRLSRYY